MRTVNVQVNNDGLANLAIDVTIHITAQGNDLLQVNTPTFTIPRILRRGVDYSYSTTQNTNICAALDIDNDCPQFFVPADSHAPWTIVTDNTATGNQALQSGTIDHNQRSCIGFTQNQPFALSFNWRVSSQKGFDFLYYYTNGNRQVVSNKNNRPGQHISGITPYTMVSKIITKGSTIEWCYQKDKSTASGDDAGWLDGVVTASTNRVIAHLSRTRISQGSNATLTLNGINLTSTTTLLLSTQTSSNTADPYASIPPIAFSPSTITLSAGNSISTVNVQVNDVGLANLAINVAIHITAQSTRPITINTPTFTIPRSRIVLKFTHGSDTREYVKYFYSSSQNTNICAALDIDTNCPQFFVSEDSHASWTIVTDNTAIGNQALQSGMIGHNQRSCIGFTKSKPFALSFNWRVSSQRRFDFLYYFTNEHRQTAILTDDRPGQHISGITPYTMVRKTLAGTGDITIEWCYRKDRVISTGDDAGWLDKLAIITPTTVTVDQALPTITEGTSTTVTITAAGIQSTAAIVVLVSDKLMLISEPTVTLSPQSPSKTIVVKATRNGIVDLADRPATMTLFISGNGSLRDETRSLTFNIVNSDVYTVGFIPTATTIKEGQSTEVTITIMPTPIEDIQITLSSSNTAQLSISPAQAKITKDSTNTTVTITAIADTSAENDQIDSVVIIPRNNVVAATSLIVTIPANDMTTVTATLAQDELDEADTTTLTITAHNVMTTFTISLSADDVLSLSSTQITFSEDGTQTITVTALDDTIGAIRNTQATITLATTPSNDVGIIPPNQLTITIIDNDYNLVVCAALDIPQEQCPQFFTSQDSDASWSVVADNTAIGSRALRSGVITHNQISCIGFTRDKPFALTFNWRVSSEERSDFLRYYQDSLLDNRDLARGDSIPGVRISGEVDPYVAVTKRLNGLGETTIEWCFTNDAGSFGGDDAGWLDNLRFFSNSISASLSRKTMLKNGQITLFVEAPIVASGTTITLSVQPDGIELSSTMLSFTQMTTAAVIITAQNVSIPLSSKQLRSTITLSANDETALQTPQLIFYVNSSTYNNALCAALDITGDCPTLFTSADSNAFWSVVDDNNAIGGQALRSGAITGDQISCIGFKRKKPFILGFNWRVSSEFFDFLRYYQDSQPGSRDLTGRNEPGVRISGTSVGSYLAVIKQLTGSGDATIEWCFAKVDSDMEGADAGWLDNVAIRAPYQIGFNPSVLILAESQTTEVTITITPTPIENIMLTLTASSTAQLSLSSAQITIPQGTTSTQVTITATDDDRQESDQSYAVTIAVRGNVLLSKSPSPLTVTIPANDTPIPTVTAILDQNEINEGDQTFLTLTATNIKEPTTITLMPTGDITVDNTEIVLTTNGMTTVAVTANNDNTVIAAQRAATITLTAAPVSVSLQTTKLTLVIIEDDSYLIGFIPSQLTLVEGTSEQVTIAVEPTPVQGISLSGTVVIKIADQAQIKATPSTYTLSAHAPQASFFIEALGDTIFEQESTHILILTTPDDIPSQGSNRLTVTIPANDTPTPIITATLADDELNEADTTTFTITARNVITMFTLNLNADNALTLTTTQITFSKDSTQIITVTAFDDVGVIPTARTIKATITLATTSSNVDITPSNQFTITITDNDYNLAICAALDIPQEQCPQFFTSQDSDASWHVVADITAQGGQALRSGAITDEQISCIGFTREKPFVFAFNWRVSSEESFDFLRYYQDAMPGSRDLFNDVVIPGVRISGEGDPYVEVIKGISDSGNATIEWCYTKDIRISYEKDAGYLDNLRFVDNFVSASLSKKLMLKSDRITLIVDALIVADATTITLSAEPEGITLSSTMLHFTRAATKAVTISANNVVIPSSKQQLRSTITLSANDETLLQNPELTFFVSSDEYNNQLCAALDITDNCPELFASADSSALWFIIDDKTAQGGQALRSGAISDNQLSCIGFTRTKPFTLAFNWRVSSEATYDFLRYYQDSMSGSRDLARGDGESEQGVRISGEGDPYVEVIKGISDSGNATIEWCYTKDRSEGTFSGEDAGYLDSVAIRNPYQIGFNPSALTLVENQAAEVTITITSTPIESIKLTLTASSTTQLSLSSTQITIPQGATSAQVTITATDDDIQESEQSYAVTIAVGGGVLSAIPSSLTVIIPANDTPIPTVTAQLDQSEINEGDQAVLTFTTANIKEPTTITLLPQGNVTVSSTEIVLQTDIKTTVAVTADDDNTVMVAQRSATIKLSAAPAGVSLQTTVITIIITEDDPYQIGFIPAQITLTEGVTRQVTITATPPPLQDIALTFASQDTSKLTISPTDVTLTANTSSRQVVIFAVNNNRPERAQTYAVNAAVTNNALASITTQLMVTIPANDTPTISFTQAAANTLEEESIVITINSAPPPTEPVQATIAFNEGTLTADRIASPTFPTTLTIQAGLPSTSITITPLDDQTQQSDQSATLTLTLTSPFTQLGTPNRLVLTIDASDQPNSITLIPTELTLQEGNNRHTHTHSRSIKPSDHHHLNEHRSRQYQTTH